MSETDTTKVVGLDFTVKDQTSGPAGRMAMGLQHVSRAAEQVTSRLSAMGRHTAVTALGAVGLGFGFREIAAKAKEANLELADGTKKLAGMTYAFGQWRAGASAQDKWNASMKTSATIMEQLDPIANRLKIGSDALAGTYRASTAMAERHGLTMAEQLGLTEKLGAAEKVLGVSAEFSANQIAKMALTGTVSGLDDFSKSMRFAIGDLKKFAKLSEPERFRRIQKALGDLVPAAEAMGKGLSGGMFDVRSAIDDVTRDVTGPVFKEVTKELALWGRNMSAMRDSGKSLSSEIGGKLVTAFGYLKSTTSFIADHWKSIALIWGASKAAGWAQGLSGWAKGGGAVGAAGGVAGAGVMTVTAGVVNVNQTAATALGATAGAGAEAAMKPGFRGVVGGLAGMAGKITLVTQALTALYLGADAAAKAVDAHQSSSRDLEANFGANSALGGRTGYAITESMRRMRTAAEEDARLGRSGTQAAKEAKAALTAYKAAYGPEVIAGGKVNVSAAREAYGAMDPSTRRQQMAALGMDISYTTGQTQNQFADRLAKVIAELVTQTAKPEEAAMRLTKPRDIKINVQKLEVTQDFKQADPDRIFHRIPNDIAEMVLAPHGSNVPMVPEY